MNTNMTGIQCFQKNLHSCALDESILSIRRVNPSNAEDLKQFSEKILEKEVIKAQKMLCKSIQ